MSRSQTTAGSGHDHPHGAIWEMSHHPVHSASVALHWVLDENAHEEHPHLIPRHYTFIEFATFAREMDRL